MPDTNSKPLARVCIRVFKEDYDLIQEMAASSEVEMSANLIIRTIVHTYANQVRADRRKRIDELKTALPKIESIDLGDLTSSNSEMEPA